ncbi:hypothetical protein NKG94_34230 [Micromonospora sp. M12]
MSVPQYRKAAAVALVAGLGLSLTACSTKSDDKSTTAGGKVTITVDCQPVGAQKELLKNWNDDVVEFQKQNRTSSSRASASASSATTRRTSPPASPAAP